MRRLTEIIALMLLVSSISFASGNNRKANIGKEKIDTIHVIAKVPFVPNATIFTPSSVIYNDEIISKRYRGYTLFDLNNKKILRVKASLEEPIKLSLKTGEYVVKLDGRKSKVYRIAVSDSRFNEFVIE